MKSFVHRKFDFWRIFPNVTKIRKIYVTGLHRIFNKIIIITWASKLNYMRQQSCKIIVKFIMKDECIDIIKVPVGPNNYLRLEIENFLIDFTS